MKKEENQKDSWKGKNKNTENDTKCFNYLVEIVKIVKFVIIAQLSYVF